MEHLTDHFMTSFVGYGQELLLAASASSRHSSQILNKFDTDFPFGVFKKVCFFSYVRIFAYLIITIKFDQEMFYIYLDVLDQSHSSTVCQSIHVLFKRFIRVNDMSRRLRNRAAMICRKKFGLISEHSENESMLELCQQILDYGSNHLTCPTLVCLILFLHIIDLFLHIINLFLILFNLFDFYQRVRELSTVAKELLSKQSFTIVETRSSSVVEPINIDPIDLKALDDNWLTEQVCF